MSTYILGRLAQAIPVLWVVATIVFVVTRIAPGDPAQVMLGDNASTEQVAALRASMGLDRPLVDQYFTWLGGALRGDLGSSFFLGETVVAAVAGHIGPTLTIALLAELAAVVIAVPIGITAATRPDGALDRVLVGALVGLGSVPSFLVGMVLLLVFGVILRVVPTAGYVPLSEGLSEAAPYLMLPALALMTTQVAVLARMTRSAMIEVLGTTYMRAGRARGVVRPRLVFKHALRNAALPLLTVVGQSFGNLIAGAIVVETLFNIPGIGQLTLNAISRRDFAVIQGVVLFSAAVYILINLVVDLLYGVVDPRVRVAARGQGDSR